jgi:nucleoside-diphosphate-sugar epimerase
MKVFVTGASGYVGSAVAAALARFGHDVFGLVRSAEKAAKLEAIEVTPVIGSMGDPSGYREAARRCQVLVHCAAESSASYFELDGKTVDTCLAVARESGQPRLFVYTSGVWVHGETGTTMVDEESPLKPPAFIARRVEHEKLVLAANQGRLRAVVIRPGCVYGGRGGLTGAWFESALKGGAAKIIGDGAFRWAMVHVDDLADAYVRVVESPFSNEVFNVTDRSRFTVLECAQVASRAAGANGEVTQVSLAEATKAMGPFAECLTLNQHVDARKAVRMLGWLPRHGGFVDGVSRYYAAWKASAAR